MREVIFGSKYDFVIVADEREFYIQAIDKFSLRCSCINNLNPVLSELGVDTQEGRFCDSIWDNLSKGEGREFFKISESFLSDDSFRRYVEGKLDEDRLFGEWENIAS